MTNRNDTVTITLAVADALELFDVVAQARADAEGDLETAQGIGDKAEVKWLTDAVDTHTRVYDALEAVVGSGTGHWEAGEVDEYEEDDLTADEATEAHTTFYDGVCEQCSTGLVRAVRCRLQQPASAVSFHAPGYGD